MVVKCLRQRPQKEQLQVEKAKAEADAAKLELVKKTFEFFFKKLFKILLTKFDWWRLVRPLNKLASYILAELVSSLLATA